MVENSTYNCHGRSWERLLSSTNRHTHMHAKSHTFFPLLSFPLFLFSTFYLDSSSILSTLLLFSFPTSFLIFYFPPSFPIPFLPLHSPSSVLSLLLLLLPSSIDYHILLTLFLSSMTTSFLPGYSFPTFPSNHLPSTLSPSIFLSFFLSSKIPP